MFIYIYIYMPYINIDSMSILYTLADKILYNIGSETVVDFLTL